MWLSSSSHAFSAKSPPTTMATEQRELNYYQRNLIDTCFEEGQFDSALDLLEQMRSPNTRLLR